jgi:hypothetical protein
MGGKKVLLQKLAITFLLSTISFDDPKHMQEV